MSRAILFFENAPEVVRRFERTYLVPGLERFGKASQGDVDRDITMSYVDYYTDPDKEENHHSTKPLAERRVAEIAGNWLNQHSGIERLALVVDLSPDSSETPNVEYGLSVIRHLSSVPALCMGLPLNHVLASPNHLVSLLSLYLDKLEDALPRVWPGIPPVCKIRRDKASSDQGVSAAVEALSRNAGLRVVLANRAEDMKWLATVMAQWI